MTTEANTAIVENVTGLLTQIRNAYRAVAPTDLTQRMKFDGLLRGVSDQLKLIDAAGLIRQPEATPTPSPEPTVAIMPAKVAKEAVAIVKRGDVPRIDIPAMKRAVESYTDLKKVLASFIKDEDKFIVSINTPSEEGQEILNNFTQKTAKLYLVFTTNSAAWLLTMSAEGIYSVTDSKFWKIDR